MENNEVEFVRNFIIDFNAILIPIRSREYLTKGTIIRLIDLEPTAGFCLAEVLECHKYMDDEFFVRVHPLEGTLQSWDPQEI